MLALKTYLVPCQNVLLLFRNSNLLKNQLNFLSKTNLQTEGFDEYVPNKGNPENKNWLEKYKRASNSTVNEAIKLYLKSGRVKRAIQLHNYQSEHNKDFQLNLIDHLQLINATVKKGCLIEAQYLLGKVKRDEEILWKYGTTRAVIDIFASLKLQKAPLSEIQMYEDGLVFNQQLVPPKVLESIMHLYLVDYGDIDSAFNLFKRIADKFRQTCYQQKLLCKLIENENVDAMKTMLNISTRIHNKENSIRTMAMAFIECGRIDQAKKLFESQKPNDGNRMITGCIYFHLSRGDSKLLKGMLMAFSNLDLPKIRREIYASLLKIYQKDASLDEMRSLISEMDAEQLVPDKEMRDQVIVLFRKNEIDWPKSWAKIDDDYGSQLECLLNADKMCEANELLCELLDEGKTQQEELLHHFFLKNSEHGILSIFEYFEDKLDDATKKQLRFHAHECDAYKNAGQSEEYIKMLRRKLSFETSSLENSMKNFTDNIIEMISQYPNIYDEYKKLATEIADKGLLTPMCFVWTYNFINRVNDTDNQLIWKKYFATKSTFICSRIPRLLHKRKETDRLRVFLSLRTLNKLHIDPKVLGESYGFLLNALIKNNQDYDTVILELKNAMNYISKNDLNKATKNVLKSGRREITDKIFNILNSK